MTYDPPSAGDHRRPNTGDEAMPRPRPSTMRPDPAFTIAPWEAERFGVKFSTLVSVTPVDHTPTGLTGPFLVQCCQHRTVWLAPTSDQATQLVEAPYAWCDPCRAANDVMTRRLLARAQEAGR